MTVYHPAAGLFPLMDGVAFRDLADNIREHGLLEPIVLLDGMVLDGRNRLRACELVGVEPRFVEWEPNGQSPTEHVLSLNLHRRHLTTGQRAALALDLLPRLEEEARERQRGGQGGVLLSPESDEAIGRSDEKAAKLVGVGRTAVATAKAIQRRDETGEVIDRMRAGEINVEQAAREAGVTTSGKSRDRGALTTTTTDAAGREQPVYFGKGDKWDESTVPLNRYLAAWEKRDYRFGHVNPREANRRLKRIDELIAGLEAARRDLAERSHTYRLTV